MTDEALVHHFAAIAERIEDQTRVIAEGHQILVEKFVGVNQRLDRLEAGQARLETEIVVVQNDLRSFTVETRARLDAHDARFDAIDKRLDAHDARFDGIEDQQQRFEARVMNEFGEVKAMIKFSVAELDRRIATLEGAVQDLLTRVERLESRAS